MARVGETMPAGWASLPAPKLVEMVGLPTLFACMKPIEAYYNERLPLWRVLNHYGTSVGATEDWSQVSCRLPSHGSNDANKSARYFARDRDTGKRIGGVYCWVCQKTMRAFRYVQTMEKASGDMRLAEVFVLIESLFRIPFPRHILFDFDPVLHYTWEGDAKGHADFAARFARAKAVKDAHRVPDPFSSDQGQEAHRAAWFSELLALYNQPVEAS